MSAKVLAAAVLAVVAFAAAGCGGGGSGGTTSSDGGRGGTTSAKDWVRAVCSAGVKFKGNLTAKETSVQTQLSQLSGSHPDLGKAREMIVSFIGTAESFLKAWRAAIKKAGTPDVSGGDKLAAAVAAELDKGISALDELKTRAANVSTTSAQAFENGLSQLPRFSSLVGKSETLAFHSKRLKDAAKHDSTCRRLVA